MRAHGNPFDFIFLSPGLDHGGLNQDRDMNGPPLEVVETASQRILPHFLITISGAQMVWTGETGPVSRQFRNKIPSIDTMIN
jgi:hypothetical protein